MDELYPTLYKISFWDEDSKACLKRNGIFYARDLGDAVAQLEDWYGKDEIDSVEIHLLEHQLFEITNSEFVDFLKRG